MDRLAAMIPDLYASKAQLRTLQRRVKAWRTERAKKMVLGSLRKAAAMHAEIRQGNQASPDLHGEPEAI